MVPSRPTLCPIDRRYDAVKGRPQWFRSRLPWQTSKHKALRRSPRKPSNDDRVVHGRGFLKAFRDECWQKADYQIHACATRSIRFPMLLALLRKQSTRPPNRQHPIIARCICHHGAQPCRLDRTPRTASNGLAGWHRFRLPLPCRSKQCSMTGPSYLRVLQSTHWGLCL